MVDTFEKLAEFRRKYNFPEDVEVRYCSEDEAILSKGEDKVVLPLVAVVEGGVRIPMCDLLTNFLHYFKVYPNQCILNVFRIISSVDNLNKRLRLNLTEHDINYMYSFQDSKTSRYYFNIRHREVRLIFGLLNFNKEIEGDYLVILGNWYPNGIHCPIKAGKAGR